MHWTWQAAFTQLIIIDFKTRQIKYLYEIKKRIASVFTFAIRFFDELSEYAFENVLRLNVA